VHVANNGFSKGWILAIVAILIAQAAFIRIITTENAPQIEIEGANAPVYDEQNRYIIFVGEVEMRIPDEVLDWTQRPVNPYEILSLTFCWPEVETYNTCADYKSRVRVHLQAQPSSHEFPFNNGDSVIARIAERYGEPVEMANPLVSKYEIKPGSNAANYVIWRLRESGHYPLAGCDGSTCKVNFTPQPGLRVTYEFWQSHIDDWQNIDQFIVSRIDDFTLDN
jgi:hypothetical protein